MAFEVKTLTEENESLKETISDLEKSKISKKTVSKLKHTTKYNRRLINVLQKRNQLKNKLLKIRIDICRREEKMQKLNVKIEQLMGEIQHLQNKNQHREALETVAENEMGNKKKQLRDVTEERDWLADLLKDSDMVHFIIKKKNSPMNCVNVFTHFWQ